MKGSSVFLYQKEAFSCKLMACLMLVGFAELCQSCHYHSQQNAGLDIIRNSSKCKLSLETTAISLCWLYKCYGSKCGLRMWSVPTGFVRRIEFVPEFGLTGCAVSRAKRRSSGFDECSPSLLRLKISIITWMCILCFTQWSLVDLGPDTAAPFIAGSVGLHSFGPGKAQGPTGAKLTWRVHLV